MKKTTEEFIRESKLIHGETYDYSLVRYSHGKASVDIICPTHGKFSQRAKHHIDGHGCKKCSSERLGIRYTDESWSKEDKVFFKENFGKKSLRSLCKLMNKSMQTLQKMKNKMNLSIERFKPIEYKDIKNKFWKSVIGGARNRGLSFNITPKYVWDIFISQKMRCALTGWEISFDDKVERTASIDRINSSIGYEMGNIQVVHKSINKLKMAWPETFLFDASKAIFLQNKNKHKRKVVEWEIDTWHDTIFPNERLVEDNEPYQPPPDREKQFKNLFDS